MKALTLVARTALLLGALALLITGLLPAEVTAAEAFGPCSDDGCPGGDSFCDYVIINGEVYPCNLGAVVIEVE